MNFEDWKQEEEDLRVVDEVRCGLRKPSVRMRLKAIEKALIASRHGYYCEICHCVKVTLKDKIGFKGSCGCRYDK